MENLPKEIIEKISQEIIKNGEIIAKHGTSVDKAKKIMETGFNYTRTSYVMQTDNNIEHLYSYGWKENGPGDATNVIIQVPREFFKELLGYSDEQYNSWISNVKESKRQEDLLRTVTDIEYLQEGRSLRFKGHIPREFIVGAFIWCNNMTYLRLGPNDNAVDNLNFIKNKYYYCNLPIEEKKNFVEMMRRKMFKNENTQSESKSKTIKNQSSFDDENPGGYDR